KSAPQPAPSASSPVVLEQFCLAKNGKSCTELAKLYAQGNGVERSAARATDLLTQGCAASDPNACALLGVQYLRGDGVRSSAPKAHELLEKACQLGNGEACLIHAVTSDFSGPRQATALREQVAHACRLLGLQSCTEAIQ